MYLLSGYLCLATLNMRQRLLLHYPLVTFKPNSKMRGLFRVYCLYVILVMFTGCTMNAERKSESGRGDAYCSSVKYNCRGGTYSESINLLGEKECTCVSDKYVDRIISTLLAQEGQMTVREYLNREITPVYGVMLVCLILFGVFGFIGSSSPSMTFLPFVSFIGLGACILYLYVGIRCPRCLNPWRISHP